MKNCVGFDIGNHAIHVAVRKGGEIVRSISERLPEGLVQSGRITSVEAMSDMLKEIRRNNKLHIKNAALVLPSGLCYCRRFTIAAMSKDQLLFNLPYEFHDFITDDKRNYFFDYAVVGVTKDEQGNPTEYDLIGAATRKDVIADYTSMFNKAGFKLKIAIPEELAYINVLRSVKGDPHKHAILDIGHNAVRLFMFLGDQFESVRVIDYGCNALDVVISEKYGVDDHYLSSTYRETNYEGANELEGCREIYNAMTIEILKAVNFYRFNGGGMLEHLHCCGGGAKNEALIETLRRGLPLEVTGLNEFFANAKPIVATQSAADMPSDEEQPLPPEQTEQEEQDVPNGETPEYETQEEQQPSDDMTEEGLEQENFEEEAAQEGFEEGAAQEGFEQEVEPSAEEEGGTIAESETAPELVETVDDTQDENGEEAQEEGLEQTSEQDPEAAQEGFEQESPEENLEEGFEQEATEEEVAQDKTSEEEISEGEAAQDETSEEEASEETAEETVSDSGEGTQESETQAVTPPAAVPTPATDNTKSDEIDYAVIVAAAGATMQ